jgi:hypothetical protein
LHLVAGNFIDFRNLIRHIEASLTDADIVTSLSQSIRNNLRPETIVASLSSPQRAERYLATEHLKENLEDQAYQIALSAALQSNVAFSPLLLDSLSSISALGTLPLFEILVACLSSNDVLIRRNSARVVAHCFGLRCRELSPWFGESGIRFECCFSGDLATAHALMRWYVEHDQTPDIAFGLLLTPTFVCDLASQFSEHASSLTRQFGYCADEDHAAAIPLLEAGLWCVPTGLTEREQRPFEQRTESFVSELLALLKGQGTEEALGLDPSLSLDQAALCGAVRSLDHQSFVQHKFENRLHARQFENVRRALCKHAPFNFCRKILIENPLCDAEQLGISTTLRGQYLLEHAAALVTHDANLRIERMLYLKSRWASRKDQRAAVPSRWTFPVELDADAPELKYRVLTSQQLACTRNYLDAPSPGALAAARLLGTVGRSDLIQPLFEAEENWKSVQCPLGIEIQVPFSPRRESDSLAWKQALRALGISSPRRPEYRTMVEASFPPSRAYHSQVLLPLALEQLGLFTEPVDMALHISFSGYLGPDVRYLLFAQQFINEPMVRPRATRLARLMSKGFAHVNYDAMILDGVNHDGLRTELRACRFGYEGATEAAPLQRKFIDDIIETSILIAARQSTSSTVQQIWHDFGRQIDAATKQLPEVFETLLNADWYASTEEPSDEAFARRLPISLAWIAVRKCVAEQGLAVELRQLFGQIRMKCAEDALSQLNMTLSCEAHGNASSRCGAAYFDPAATR